MSSLKGIMRTLLIVLCLIAILSFAMCACAEEIAATDADVADIQEPEPAHEPEPDEMAKPAETPNVSQAEATDEPDSEELGLVEPEALEPSYTVCWAGGAFNGQTVNYQNELIIGAGNSCVIDPVHDIYILRDGEPIKKRKRIAVSFQSSNEKFVTVSKGGRVNGIRRGSAQVKVTIALPDGSEKQLRQDIKVVEPPTLMFVPGYAVLENGAKLNLSQFAGVPLLQVSPNVDAGVTYSVAAKGETHGSSVVLSRETGELAAIYDAPGDVYVVTAESYSGETATFTLYLGQRAQQITILAPEGSAREGGAVVIRAGESVQLSSVIYSGNGELAGRQDVAWSISCDAGVAAIDRMGHVIAGRVDGARNAVVTAAANDGSWQSAELAIVIVP